MSVQVVPYALTSLTKVKNYLGISDTSADTFLTYTINAVTDMIEKYCGGRRFLQTAYASTDDNTLAGNATAQIFDTNEQHRIFFNQWPVKSVEKVEFRGGTPAQPQWFTFDPQGYYFYLKEGYVYFFMRLPKVKQGLRLSYTAGYLIDFANEGNPTKHELPMDISMVATEVVAKIYQYKNNLGQVRVQTEGQMIMWDKDILGSQFTDAHKQILLGYKANRLMI